MNHNGVERYIFPRYSREMRHRSQYCTREYAYARDYMQIRNRAVQSISAAIATACSRRSVSCIRVTAVAQPLREKIVFIYIAVIRFLLIELITIKAAE